MPEDLKAKLPPLVTRDYERVYDGHEWIDAVADDKNGWYIVPSWGSDGWNFGEWPYVIIAHYDDPALPLYGQAVYVEGDIEITAYATRRYRDQAADSTAVFYWKNYETESAPKDVNDPRCGPYRGYNTDTGLQPEAKDGA